MNIRRSGFSYFLIILLATSIFTAACGKVKPLNLSSLVDEELSWETLVTQGQAAFRNGKLDVAEKTYLEALSKCEEKFGEDDARTGNCVGYLAELYKYKQDWLKAEKEYKRWLMIMDKHDSTGEQVKVIRRGYREVKDKIKKYGLRKDTSKKTEEKSDDDAQEKDTE